MKSVKFQKDFLSVPTYVWEDEFSIDLLVRLSAEKRHVEELSNISL